MNWKPPLIAAVVVVALGLGAGAAIGGQTKTMTRTVAGPTKTVVQTVTTPGSAAVPAATTRTDTAATVATEGTETDGEPQYLTAGDVHPQDGGLSVDEAGVNASLQRGGELSDSVLLDLPFDSWNGATPDYWSAEVPIPAGKSRFQTTMGFEKGSPSGNSVTVEFRQDSLRGELIKKVRLSATEIAEVDVPVAADGGLLVLKLVAGEDAWRDNDSAVRFVLGEARFV